MHTETILQFFEYEHLPPRLQALSQPFHELAHNLCESLEPCAERTAGLRKLLEGKDCMVRAAVAQTTTTGDADAD